MRATFCNVDVPSPLLMLIERMLCISWIVVGRGCRSFLREGGVLRVGSFFGVLVLCFIVSNSVVGTRTSIIYVWARALHAIICLGTRQSCQARVVARVHKICSP